MNPLVLCISLKIFGIGKLHKFIGTQNQTRSFLKHLLIFQNANFQDNKLQSTFLRSHGLHRRCYKPSVYTIYMV